MSQIHSFLKTKQKQEAKDQVLEGYEEHHVARLLLSELEALPVDHERWLPKLIVLREAIDHHVKEEEDQIFSDARKYFDRKVLAIMGERFMERKAEMILLGSNGPLAQLGSISRAAFEIFAP